MTDASNQQPEPFNLNSDDVAAHKRAELKRLFPEVFNEDKIDLDQLRRAMGDCVDEGTERFGLTWPGKAACMKVIQAPATGTLRPDRDESVNFDESENVFIEGDNLEVLKLLQKAYFGRIRLVYIDPPYNTGKEFIYPDRYSETLETYLAYTRQVDDEGQRFSTNSDTAGRFHSRWLNMMYPRLYLAKNLLREDGFIAVSIDDNEQINLRAILNQVFGEENFVAELAIITGANQSGDGILIQKNHEKCMIFARDIEAANVNRVDEVNATTRNLNDAPTPLHTRDDMGYTIYYNEVSGELIPRHDYDKTKIHLNKVKEVYEDDSELISQGFVPIRPGFRNNKLHRWRWGKDTFLARIDEIVVKGAHPDFSVHFTQGGLNPPKSYHNYGGGATEVSDLFDGERVFDYPKGTAFLAYLTQILSSKDDIVLDFFAGSGSLAHALAKLKAEGLSNRRHISVQLPEPVDDDSPALAFGLTDLATLSRERIRRAENALLPAIARGFRAFKLARSSFSPWEASSEIETNDLITKIESHAKHTASEDNEDILFELLLKDGFELTTKIEQIAFAGGKAFTVADGALIVCLERNLTKGIIDALADLAEEKDAARVVCLDAGFQGNDQLKTNAVQTFKSRLGHGEDGSMFRTV